MKDDKYIASEFRNFSTIGSKLAQALPTDLYPFRYVTPPSDAFKLKDITHSGSGNILKKTKPSKAPGLSRFQTNS